MPANSLPKLPAIPRQSPLAFDFSGSGPGGFVSTNPGGVATPVGGSIWGQVPLPPGLPGISIPGTSGSLIPGTGWLNDLFPSVAPGGLLLRLVLLIIGLICVIGAIYLYKPTQNLVAGPIQSAHGAARDAATAIAAA